MADAALFIGFGEVVRGREKRALKNFNDSTEYYTGLQNEGRIESFDVILLGPHARLNGFIVMRGTEEQLDAVRHSKEFRVQVARARLIVDDLVIAEAYVGEGLAQVLSEYQEELNAAGLTGCPARANSNTVAKRLRPSSQAVMAASRAHPCPRG